MPFYTIPINFAVANSVNPVPQLMMVVTQGIVPGQAMGPMGLTYNTTIETAWYFKVVTSGGSTAGVNLNGQ